MIIVTGATGFIGSAMIWQLNNRGFKNIIAVDTVPLSVRPKILEKRQFARFLGKDDIWQFLETKEAKSHVEAIVHMGACSATTELNVAFLTENNFDYTRRLWTWCADNQKPLIYASSGAVYGDGNEGFDDASASKIFKPLNPYGESKAQFDRFVEKAVEEKQTLPPHWYGLRFFNVYGPNEYLKDDMSSVVFKAFNQIRETGRLRLFKSHRPDFKDGEQLRDFVYVKDIVRWMDELLLRTGTSTTGAGNSTADAGAKPAASGIYNMGFGQARSWNDLAKATFAGLGRDLAIDFVDIPEALRARYQYFTQAKMDRLLALGLSKPQWPLEAGVQDYIANHLKNEASPWL